MKKISLFIILAAFACTLSAQTSNLPGMKELKEGHFAKAERKIVKAYKSDSSNVTNCYLMGLLYGNTKNPRRNNERAYRALLRGRELMGNLNNLSKSLLKRDGVSLEAIEKSLEEVTAQGLADASAINTKEAYNHYRDYYAATITKEQDYAAREGISGIDFDIAERENSIEGYEHFVSMHPESSKAEVAEQRIHAMAYAKAKSLNTLKAYERFVDEYPDSEEAEEAEQQVYSMMYYKAMAQNTEEAFRRYAQDYPDSPYAAQARRKASAMHFAKDTDPNDWESFKRYIERHPDETRRVEEAKRIIVDISIENKNADGLEWSLHKCDSSLRDTIVRAMHDLYVNSDRIAEFEAVYGRIVPADLKKKDQEALDAILDVQTNDRSSVVKAIKAIAPYRIAYDLLLYMIELDASRGKWEYVKKNVYEFEELFAGNDEYAALKATVSAPERKLNRQALDANINTPTGDEYSPVVSADEQTIYFAGKNRKGNIGGEDIFMSTKNASGQWRRAYPVPGLNTTGHNESPSSISRDGQTIIIFQNGKLMISHKDDLGWTMPKPLPKQLQTGTWQSDAMITPDGRAILFTARTKTEHEVAPSMNIYVTTLKNDGSWSEPVSLGPTINTFGNDRAPFLHADMKTLYFSSNRHSNIGKLDVFKSERLSDESWTEWSEPVNLGKEINTVGDDCWFSVNVDGTKAYMSTKIGESQEICTIDLPEDMRPGKVATLTGKVNDVNGNPQGVELRWIDLQTGKLCGIYKTDPTDGSFYITLPLGKQYEYYIANEGYYPTSGSIDLRTTSLAKKEHTVLVTANADQMAQGCSGLPVEGMYFSNSKSSLTPQSKYAVKRLAKTVKQVTGNGHRTVAITVYTDAEEVGKTTNLDRQRAEAVKEALVKAGCKAETITVKVKEFEKGKTLPSRLRKHRSLMTAEF